MKNINFRNIKILDGFWNYYNNLNNNSIVKNVYNRFEETGRFEALKCNWQKGNPNKPHIYWDSDIAKWIEGAAYIIEQTKNSELECLIDEMIENIEKNQREDGYFNSYFLSVEPEQIFKNRDNHELYCIGHFIEAAIAYNIATGKDKLLNCVLKMVDNVYKVFVVEKSAKFVTPGHEEIELALIKLYLYLNNKKHLELAEFFINNRGNNDIDILPRNQIKDSNEYSQSNVPVRQINQAVGHSVRACYLYTAMVMLAKVNNDTELLNACKRVFNNIVTSKMSITGGVGSDHIGENFSYEYDLPNSDTYNETCAAISLALFSGELQETEVNSEFGNIIEKIYYNGFLSGVSLDGEKFFYTNPLEIDRKKYKRSTYQPICERVKVFECSCCPPNVVRMLGSINRYMYTVTENAVLCNQFAATETNLTVNGKKAVLNQITDYPNSGKITFEYKGAPTDFFVRIPKWCVEYKGKTTNGFAHFKLKGNDKIVVNLPLKLHFMESNVNLQDNSGRYAAQYGPLVYCLEEVDNGSNLRDITLLENSKIKVVKEQSMPAPVIYINAERRISANDLYKIKSNKRTKITAKLIPYFCFANRGPSDMIVWVNVR